MEEEAGEQTINQEVQRENRWHSGRDVSAGSRAEYHRAFPVVPFPMVLGVNGGWSEEPFPETPSEQGIEKVLQLQRRSLPGA